MATATQSVTEWDAQGNPVGAPTEWDAKGSPVRTSAKGSELRTPSLDELSSPALPPTGSSLPRTPFPSTPFSGKGNWLQYAKPGPYTTELPPDVEQQFQSWAKKNKIPWQDSATSDYDMRGYWKAQQAGDPDAQRATNGHFPDTWKTPYHKTFSNESQYALPTAGHWEGNKFVPPSKNPLDVAGANPQNAVGGDLNATPVLTQEEQKRAGSISAPPPSKFKRVAPGPHGGFELDEQAANPADLARVFPSVINPDATLQGGAPTLSGRGFVALQGTMTPTEQAEHPIATGLGQLAEGLTTPENLAILAGTAGLGELPAAGRAALSAYFASQMAKGATDYGVQGWEAYKRGDNKEAQRLWTLAAGSAALGGAAGAHGIRESGILPGETDSVVPRGEVPKGTISAPLAKDAAVARAGRIMPEVEANAAARRGLPAVDQAVAAQREAALNAPVNLPKLPETTEPTPILRGSAQGPKPNPLSKEAAEVRDQQAERAAKAPPEEQPVQVTDKRRVGAGGEQLIPEAFHTLKAQTDALDKGTNSVVYFPKGTDALPPPPEDATVTVVKGDKAGAGTYYHDDSVTPQDIRKAVKNGTFGELIGHTQTKEEATTAGAPAVVVARTADGTELKSSVVDGNNPEAVAAQKKTLQEQFPEAVIAQGKPEAVIAHRQGTQPAQAENAPQTAVSRQTPANQQRTGTANERPQVQYKPSEKAATMSATNTDRGPEFNAQQWQEEINRNNEILRNPKATEEERQIATDRLRDAKEGAAQLAEQSAPKGLPRGPATKLEKFDGDPYGQKMAQLATNRYRDPVEREYAQSYLKARVAGKAAPTVSASIDASRAKIIRSTVEDYLGKTAPQALQEKYSPETLEAARNELQDAHNLASNFERPGRYHSDLGPEASAKEQDKAWYGISSSRHWVADQFPWYGEIEQGADKLGTLIQKGKGAEYERLLDQVAASVDKAKAAAAPVMQEYAPVLRGLAEDLKDSDPEYSDMLKQLADGDGRGFTNLRKYLDERLKDGADKLSAQHEFDAARDEARNASIAEPAQHGGETGATEKTAGAAANAEAAKVEPAKAEPSAAAEDGTPEGATATEAPEGFSLKPKQSRATRPTEEQNALPGLESAIEEQRAGAGRVQGEKLTQEASAPGKNIDQAAGEMERNSPLFRNSEANPQGDMFRAAGPKVGDRVSITGSHKLSGQDAEVTKVEDAGVFVRQGDGPVKFVKNGEFEKEPESDSAKPSESAATYTHPVAAILHQVGEWFRRDPASVKEQAKASLREKLGESSRSLEQAIEKLSKVEDGWAKRSKDDSIALMTASDRGGDINSLPVKDRADALELRKLFQQDRDALNALPGDRFQHFAEEWFPRIWKEPGPARDIFAQMGSKKPLGGSKAFMKERTIPTIPDGISYGLEPVTYNPATMGILKHVEIRRFLLSEKMRNEAIENGNVIMAGDRRDLYKQLSQRSGGNANNQDWVPIQKWNGHTNVDGTGDFKQAWAPRELANVLNNYLEPGLRGNKIYDILRSASDKARFLQLGVSAFHLGSEAINSGVSSVALTLENLAETTKKAASGDIDSAKHELGKAVKNILHAPLAAALDFNVGRKVAAEFLTPGQQTKYAATADALETANGRVRSDFQYRDKFLKAYRDAARSRDKLGMAWNAAMIGLEAPTKFVMQAAMNMKLGAWHQLASDVLDRSTREDWPDDKRRFELQKAYDSIENRFGQVNYENLNMSRLAKDILQLGVRSVGWTGGTLREGLGALGDAGRNEFSHRVAYSMALPLYIGGLGALYTLLRTGQMPSGKDFFYPRTGRTLPNGEVERVSFPSYMKDVYSYTTHPVTTLQNKLSPLISQAAELIQNKDYSGNKIYQEDDETNQQVTDVAKYIAKQMIPFSVRNVQQRDESGGSVASKAERTVETALGITPANKEVSRTDAENMMAKFQRDSQPIGGRTRQEQQKKDATTEARREFQDTGDKGVLREAIQEGKITPTQASGIVKEKNVPYLQRGVQHLSLDQTLKIWDVANDDEKKILRSAIEKKAKPEALAGLSQDDKDRVIKKVRSILGNQPQQAESGDVLTKVLGRLPFGPSKAQKAP